MDCGKKYKKIYFMKMTKRIIFKISIDEPIGQQGILLDGRHITLGEIEIMLSVTYDFPIFKAPKLNYSIQLINGSDALEFGATKRCTIWIKYYDDSGSEQKVFFILNHSQMEKLRNGHEMTGQREIRTRIPEAVGARTVDTKKSDSERQITLL